MRAMQSLTASANCWMTRSRRGAGQTLSFVCGSMREPKRLPALHRASEAARDRADGEAGRDLSVEAGDGNRAGSERKLRRRHCRALREISSDGMGTGLCDVESRIGRL